MQNKIKVGIIYGGKSAEHDVSLRSAENIIDAIDSEKYEVVRILIEKNGKWFLADSHQEIALLPEGSGAVVNTETGAVEKYFDVVFPMLHGPYGEDGTIQGLLKIANVPFVGVSVLGSAVGMDKDIMKRLLRDAGVSIGKYIAVKESQVPTYADIVQKFGVPFFVKPANMGSSIGVSKVSTEEEYDAAIKDAFLYDTKVLIEENIQGREIECAVLGNDAMIASVPGEVIPTHDFYSYEAKYIDEKGAGLAIPAQISEELTKKIQDAAIQTCKALECEGLSRVDFFLKEDGDVLVNEINTMPGFTSVSMYPKMWEASGIGYTELIDRLIQLALKRFEVEQKLKTSYDVQ